MYFVLNYFWWIFWAVNNVNHYFLSRETFVILIRVIHAMEKLCYGWGHTDKLQSSYCFSQNINWNEVKHKSRTLFLFFVFSNICEILEKQCLMIGQKVIWSRSCLRSCLALRLEFPDIVGLELAVRLTVAKPLELRPT